MVMSEDEIRNLLRTAPPRRRIQARAAVTGTVGDLVGVLGQVIEPPASPDPGSQGAAGSQSAAHHPWQATLGALYMVDFAACHRPPREVADMIRELRVGYCAEAARDAAATRSPADLAAIAGALADNTEFLANAAVRRQPEDLAEMLVEMGRMSDGTPLMSSAAGLLCLSAPPEKVARLALHLRGMSAPEPLDEVLAWMLKQPAEALAEFLASLDRFRDAETVRAGIEAMIALAEAQPEPLRDPQSDVGNVVERIAELVKCLLQAKEADLAKLVVTSAIGRFTPAGQQHRLYALVFVFRELGVDAAAEQIMNEITATVPDEDIVQMIIRFCLDAPQHAGPLLRLILQTPRPGVTAAAAAEFARQLDEARLDIFRTVAAWPFDDLKAFGGREGLRATNNEWGEDFREIVKEQASARQHGDAIGDIVDWLLTDADADRGRRRADFVIAKVAERKEPALMVTLMCALRDNGRWWQQPPARRLMRREKAVRDNAALRIGEHYQLNHMLAAIEAAERRCLPAVLRLVPEWLLNKQRSDDEIVRLVRALRDARCDLKGLLRTLEWSACQYAGAHDPTSALQRAGLADEAHAWRWGTRHRVERPDPDPAPAPALAQQS
jgi:hypothetical protein